MEFSLIYDRYDFLTIFDDIYNDGDSYAIVEVNKENSKVFKESSKLESLQKDKSLLPDLWEELSENMLIFGQKIFSVTQNIPGFKDKLNPRIIEQNGNYFCLFALAPVLGLPGEKAIDEINELYELLDFIKQSQLDNLKTSVSVVLSRDPTGTTLEIHSPNKLLEEQLQFQFNQIVENSPTLQKWVENLKVGINNTDTQVDNLYSSMTASSLMSIEERKLIIEHKPKSAQMRSPLRKNRFK